MLVKCICTNCAGHLEFEEDSAGQKIKCPHCGFDTVLFLPGAEKAEAEVATLREKLQRQRRVVLVIAALLVLGGLGWAIYHWVTPFVATLLPDGSGDTLPIVVTVIACLALPFLLAWLVLPVVLFVQFRKALRLLENLELNSPPQSQTEFVSAFPRETGLEVSEDEKKL